MLITTKKGERDESRYDLKKNSLAVQCYNRSLYGLKKQIPLPNSFPDELQTLQILL